MWIIVKEKTTVDHKLCIWPSAIKNVNLRCSKEKIKGYKRNLTSILSTEQGKGSVLIYLMRLHTKETNSSEVTMSPFWTSCAAGRGRAGGLSSAHADLWHPEEPDPAVPAFLIPPHTPRNSETAALRLHFKIHHVLFSLSFNYKSVSWNQGLRQCLSEIHF